MNDQVRWFGDHWKAVRNDGVVGHFFNYEDAVLYTKSVPQPIATKMEAALDLLIEAGFPDEANKIRSMLMSELPHTIMVWPYAAAPEWMRRIDREADWIAFIPEALSFDMTWIRQRLRAPFAEYPIENGVLCVGAYPEEEEP